MVLAKLPSPLPGRVRSINKRKVPSGTGALESCSRSCAPAVSLAEDRQNGVGRVKKSHSADGTALQQQSEWPSNADTGAGDNGDPVAAFLSRALRVDHPCSPSMLVLRLMSRHQAVQKLREPTVQNIVQRNCSSPPFLLRLQGGFQVRVVLHECVDVRDMEHARRCVAPPQRCFTALDRGEACTLWQNGSQPAIGFCKPSASASVAQARDGICCDVATSVCRFVVDQVCALVQARQSEHGRGGRRAGVVNDAHGHRSLGCGACDRSRRRH